MTFNYVLFTNSLIWGWTCPCRLSCRKKGTWFLVLKRALVMTNIWARVDTQQIMIEWIRKKCKKPNALHFMFVLMVVPWIKTCVGAWKPYLLLLLWFCCKSSDELQVPVHGANVLIAPVSMRWELFLNTPKNLHTGCPLFPTPPILPSW